MTVFAKPRIALVLGDPGGIGSELTAKLLAQAEPARHAELLVLGDAKLLRRGAQIAHVDLAALNLTSVEDPARNGAELAFYDYPTLDEGDIQLGVANAAGGRAVLKTLEFALQLAQNGSVDAICFAPLNKYAMRLGGLEFEDELHFFVDRLKHRGPSGEINVLDALWTTRVTSHIALKEVAHHIDAERIVAAIRLAHQGLVKAGVQHPRIGVAALNPHAGDGGIYGREEIDIIGPAVQQAKALQIAADGPYPSDTVFLKARDGQFDAIVTMYHDQGQIAMKLLGFDKGVTLQGGLAIPITTPAHGTAYDIAGKGVASLEAMRRAFLLACKMGAARSRARGNGT